jgi:hypothetical protein
MLSLVAWNNLLLRSSEFMTLSSPVTATKEDLDHEEKITY